MASALLSEPAFFVQKEEGCNTYVAHLSFPHDSAVLHDSLRLSVSDRLHQETIAINSVPHDHYLSSFAQSKLVHRNKCLIEIKSTSPLEGKAFSLSALMVQKDGSLEPLMLHAFAPARKISRDEVVSISTQRKPIVYHVFHAPQQVSIRLTRFEAGVWSALFIGLSALALYRADVRWLKELVRICFILLGLVALVVAKPFISAFLFTSFLAGICAINAWYYFKKVPGDSYRLRVLKFVLGIVSAALVVPIGIYYYVLHQDWLIEKMVSLFA